MTSYMTVAASPGRDIVGTPDGDTLFGTAGDDTIRGFDGQDQINGSGGNDLIFGGDGRDWLNGEAGDDYINPGGNSEPAYESIDTGTGNDTVDLTDLAPGEAVTGLAHWSLTQAIIVEIDANVDTGTITKGTTEGETTILGAAEALRVVGPWGGIEVFGTSYNDTFNVSPGDNGWVGIYDYGGSDTIIIGDDAGFVRLAYGAAGSGIVANLKSGEISADGFGASDQISGPGHVDELQASDFDDDVTGSGRDEIFILRAGKDNLNAGGGFDTVRYDRRDVGAVDVDLAAGTATGTWSGEDFSHDLGRVEAVRGSRDDGDSLDGDAADNKLDGRGGNDRLDGRDGADTLIGGDDDDLMFGGDGDDQMIGDSGVYENFFLSGRQQNEPGNDFMSAGKGDDDMDGEAGNDTLEGDQGNDTVGGGDGNDDVAGGSGSDVLSGGQGRDTITGDAGNDVLAGGKGNDDLEAGEGRDTLTGDKGDDTITGGKGHDDLSGGGGADRISGNKGEDTISGGGQNDTLTGGDGNDTLDGGAGEDVLNGGSGDDTLKGGKDADTFVFATGDDKAKSFDDAGGDRIDLSSVASIQGFNDLKNNHLVQNGNNTVIDDLDGNTLTLVSVKMDDLEKADFIF